MPSLLASIPPPPLSDFSIGPITLHLYGLILGIAIIAAILVLERNLPYVGIDREHATAIAIPAVIAGVIGARLYHVFSEPTRYWESPGDIVRIWEGGLGIYGGVWAGVLVAVLAARRRGLSPARVLDAGIVGVALAQAIGRWGNYVNEELYGGPTNLPWGLELSTAAGTFHPTFLYESIWNLGNFVFLMLLFRRWNSRPDGAIVAAYFATYSLGRVWVEGMRVDHAHEWLGLRQNQWIAGAVVAVALLALALLVRRNRQRRSATQK